MDLLNGIKGSRFRIELERSPDFEHVWLFLFYLKMLITLEHV